MHKSLEQLFGEARLRPAMERRADGSHKGPYEGFFRLGVLGFEGSGCFLF